MSLKDKNAVVTGGSRGLGLGLVEALVAHGARVTVVARGAEALDSVRARLGVATISADVTDETAAHRILAELRPDILALNAGATPPMGRLDQLSWADFTAPWEHDVKAGLYWLQAALNQPLKPGSRVLVVSSGAAENGSPMSGGYGGAKRMLWFMAKYANGVSEKKRLGIRFQAIVPQQMVLGTGVGDAGANAYAHAMGMKPEEFVARFGAPMPPREFGEKVVSVLDDPKYAEGFAFGLKGDTGVTMLEAARLEHRTALAEPGPPGGAPRPGRRAAARFAPLLRTPHGIGHRRRGRRARHARPGFRGVARSGGGAAASTLAVPNCS